MHQRTKPDTAVKEISTVMRTHRKKKKRRKNGKVAFAREIIFVGKNFFAHIGMFKKNFLFVYMFFYLESGPL